LNFLLIFHQHGYPHVSIHDADPVNPLMMVKTACGQYRLDFSHSCNATGNLSLVCEADSIGWQLLEWTIDLS